MRAPQACLSARACVSSSAAVHSRYGLRSYPSKQKEQNAAQPSATVSRAVPAASVSSGGRSRAGGGRTCPAACRNGAGGSAPVIQKPSSPSAARSRRSRLAAGAASAYQRLKKSGRLSSASPKKRASGTARPSGCTRHCAAKALEPPSRMGGAESGRSPAHGARPLACSIQGRLRASRTNAFVTRTRSASARPQPVKRPVTRGARRGGKKARSTLAAGKASRTRSASRRCVAERAVSRREERRRMRTRITATVGSRRTR
ncbi:MAG: hypothetical protein BWX70_02687 [Verrucomicrobia bacterium ADurb.Bin070]|nr:MAG: hypothetical protein BWX70_02687 [Verrucomicrobia bacterium ADurb.Bin070]